MDAVISAVLTVLQPVNVIMMCVGVVIGTVFGAVPGLTSTLAIALLSPLSFNMDPIPALLLLLSIYAGGMYGGAITAITIRTPGAPANAATMIDGYALTKQGKGGVAIGISCVAGAIGGIISCVFMIFCSPILARFALMFSPVEYFAVAVFGLTAVFAVSGKSLTKGALAMLFGLLLATVGYDPILPFPRFHFGSLNLSKGIPFMPAVIGFFAFAEVFRLIAEHNAEEDKKEIVKVGRVIPNWQEIKSTLKVTCRSGVIGTLIGILPGAGGTIAAYVSYADAQKSANEPEKIGKGSLEGVAAPESGNNAVSGGAMIPMLTLGIPGDSVTAVLLGALVVQGIQPGPLLFKEHIDIVYPVFAGMIVSNIIMAVLGLMLVRPISLISTIRRPYLISFLLVFGVIGAYTGSNSLFDVGVAIVFGVIGFLMERYDFPTAPTVLAMILGPLVERSLRQSLIISNGSPLIFVTRPISAVFLGITLLVVVFTYFRTKKKALVSEG